MIYLELSLKTNGLRGEFFPNDKALHKEVKVKWQPAHACGQTARRWFCSC
jgi:hypothetical protein